MEMNWCKCVEEASVKLQKQRNQQLWGDRESEEAQTTAATKHFI